MSEKQTDSASTVFPWEHFANIYCINEHPFTFTQTHVPQIAPGNIKEKSVNKRIIANECLLGLYQKQHDTEHISFFCEN